MYVVCSCISLNHTEHVVYIWYISNIEKEKRVMTFIILISCVVDLFFFSKARCLGFVYLSYREPDTWR